MTPLRPGQTLLHYRIAEKLGEGGMGEVYRAVDTKLRRDVALKVLPVEVTVDPERLERFQREAMALAALDHPGIVTVFSVEEDAGVHFLTMQLVGGTTLDRLISQDGVPQDRLVAIAAALAEALAAAHDRGIVHRDLKPANVMVTESGQVKILDFGIAKMSESSAVGSSAPDLSTVAGTQSGVVMGTPAYMSPEQIGGRPLDARTDLFSLGVILYEMASGKRPFGGTTAVELAASILRDAPEEISRVRPDVPPALARVVHRCLEKDRERRYPSARDLSEDLREQHDEGSSATVTVPGKAGIQTADTQGGDGFWIAVLPFQARGSAPGLDGLADDLSEAIVTGLSRFSYLRVVARGSTQQYAGSSADVRAVGKELGARYVMAGSVRQAGPSLRVGVQLVDAESGAHLWAETYDRPYQPEGLFELVDDVSPRIGSTVADMHGVLPRTMSGALRDRDPEGLSPYEAVLRSFGYVERLTAEEHAHVRAGLERAVQRAPGDADCQAMLSFIYAEEHKHGFNARPAPLDRALEAARRAVAIAPTNHLCYHVLAQALFFRRELQAFRNAAERGVALNPMDGCTIAFMGILMAYAGDWDRGCALAERAMELNPHHPGWYRFSLFFNAYRKRAYREALDVALKINMPSYFYTHMALAAAYGQLGERDAAQRAVEELLSHKPDFAMVAREEFGKWLGASELLDEVMEGLRKAGLPIAG